MATISEANDALIYLDAQPDGEHRDTIEKLIQAALAPESFTTLHPLVLAQKKASIPTKSAIIESIDETGGAPKSGRGIDSNRYEEVAAPPDTKDSAAWRKSIHSASKLQSYLDGRTQNLDALEKHGKNAWLMSNFELEDELRALEKELKHAQTSVQAIDEERRMKQEGCAGEFDALAETWRGSLGRAIEAEVETEIVRKKILEVRRAKAGG